MESKIIDVDIEALCAINPMASEQLRRIVAERQKAELELEIYELKGKRPPDEIQANKSKVMEPVIQISK